MASFLKKFAKQIAQRTPYLRQVFQQRDTLLNENNQLKSSLEQEIARTRQMESLTERLSTEKAEVVGEVEHLRKQLFQAQLESKHIEKQKARLIQELANFAPWLLLLDRVHEIYPFISMMTREESAYLFWLARDYYEGKGEIIDGGCLLGGSTCCLAAGLRENERVKSKKARIHSYDLFAYCEFYMRPLVPDVDIHDGDTLLPLFLRNIKQYSEHVTVYDGDILERLDWHNAPIELLFIDVAKSWEIHDHIVHQCFRHLIPGRSIVIQQDYFHFHCFWIHITMQYLREYFSPLDSPEGGTRSFLLVDELPPSIIDRSFREMIGPEQALELMDEVIAKFSGVRKLKLMTAKIRCLVYYNKIKEAVLLAHEIRHLPDWDSALDFWVDDFWYDGLYDFVEAIGDLPRAEVLPGIGNHPNLIGLSKQYNIFLHDHRYYAVPWEVRTFDPADNADRNDQWVFHADSEPELRYLIQERIRSLPRID